MNERMKDFTIDSTFVAIILQYLYNSETKFREARFLIKFLGILCKIQNVFEFLANRHFGEYLEQLPWRYQNEQNVHEILEFCAQVVVSTYGDAINITL
jgi:hypothetical protein